VKVSLDTRRKCIEPVSKTMGSPGLYILDRLATHVQYYSFTLYVPGNSQPMLESIIGRLLRTVKAGSQRFPAPYSAIASSLNHENLMIKEIGNITRRTSM
jgi:hypothetical protein